MQKHLKLLQMKWKMELLRFASEQFPLSNYKIKILTN
jgi:hypothetical protein